MQFGFRPHQNWQFDPDDIRMHFHQHVRQKHEELILCSDNVYRPESMVEEFEKSIIRNLPMIIEQPK